MFNSSTKYAALVLGMCAFFTSACKKENKTDSAVNQPTNEHHVIKAELNANSYTTFEYNSDNQVIKMTDKEGATTQQIALTYNANKKLDVATAGTSVMKFMYTNGILSKVEYRINSVDGALTSYYEFVAQNGKISGYTNYLVLGAGNIANYKVEYTYNANGDIVTEKQYTWVPNNNQFSIYKTVTHEYDGKVNPLAATPEIAQVFFETASAHNQTKEVVKDALDNTIETNTYTYTYDSFGYPTIQNKSTVTPGDPNPVTTQIKFTYNN